MPTNPTLWTDSRGIAHDLTTASRLHIGEAARFLDRSVSTVRRLHALGELSPAFTFKSGVTEFIAPVLVDFLARQITSSTRTPAP
jgi:hypothetical protein